MSQSAIQLLIQRGQRRARELRPATLILGDGTEIPCTPGNLDFFERLQDGGFRSSQNLHVTLLRLDLPAGTEFKRGHKVQVRDEISGDVFNLLVGDNNSRQANLFILNLESPNA